MHVITLELSKFNLKSYLEQKNQMCKERQMV